MFEPLPRPNSVGNYDLACTVPVFLLSHPDYAETYVPMYTTRFVNPLSPHALQIVNPIPRTD
jgi:hypothetical protein